MCLSCIGEYSTIILSCGDFVTTITILRRHLASFAFHSMLITNNSVDLGLYVEMRLTIPADR
jgi:hypothetical protein